MARIPSYSVVYTTLALGLVAVSYWLPDSRDPGSVTLVTDRASSAISTINGVVALAVTLNTTMLAAAAAVAVKGREWSSVWTRLDGLIIVFVFLAGSVSYYGAYLANIALLEMIQGGGVSGLAPRLQRGFGLQYYGTFFGFLLLGLTFCRMLEGRRPSPDAADRP